MKLPDALNIAKSFAVVQLNADIESIRFVSAKQVGTSWEISVFFKEKVLNVGYVDTLCISDVSGEVTSFTTQALKAVE